MLIVDAHQNIAFNAQQLGRDYERWAWQLRESEGDQNLPPAMTSLPDNLMSGIGIVYGSIIVMPESFPLQESWHKLTYRAADDAKLLATWQMDYYRRLADEQDQITLILTRSDLEAVIASWQDGAPLRGRIGGIVALMEGAEPVTEPRQFEEWMELGVRIVAPACQPTRYCAAAGFTGGLTALGYELLDVLADYGILLDVSHMSERACQQAIETYPGGIIASHANPRYFYEGPRGLSDQTIRALAERDGVIGIMVYNRYLRRDWRPGDPNRRVGLDHWADAVDYVCQLTGSAAHAGLGSDIDGGYAYASFPQEVDTSADLWQLGDCLRDRGFADDDVQAILGGNHLRKLKEALPEG
ncbi:MAG: membrane dipeptidase [Chloroflexi bacterium]|nr:membrane dipeptidase [Chloroflexota bacterium]